MDVLGLEKTCWKKSFVFSQNVRSLRRNVNQLFEYLVENKSSSSVIALSETWHSDHTLFVKILGDQGFFASNHKTKSSRVALFVDKYIEVQVQDLKDNLSFDVLVVDLFLTSCQNFSAIVISNSPSNSSKSFLCKMLKNCWNRIGFCIHAWL